MLFNDPDPFHEAELLLDHLEEVIAPVLAGHHIYVVMKITKTYRKTVVCAIDILVQSVKEWFSLAVNDYTTEF